MATIVCDAGVLAKALREVAPIAERGAVSTLANVLVEAIGEDVRLTTTGMDKRITRAVAGDVVDGGSFTVDAQRFAAVMSSFDAGAQAKIVADKGFAILTCGRSRFKFATLPATDFPAMPFGDAVCAFDALPDFKRALSVVKHAFAPADLARYWMAGAFIGYRNGASRIVGTDGDRMAAVVVNFPEFPEAIVPASLVDLILKLEGDPKVEVCVGKIRLTFGSTVVTGKLIDSTYPAYERLHDVMPPIAIDFDANGMIEALSRIALVADDKDRTVKLAFERSKVTITNRSPAYEGAEEVPCDYEGEPIDLAYRAHFLREALEAMDADDVTLAITDAISPTKLTAKTKPGVVMFVTPTL